MPTQAHATYPSTLPPPCSFKRYASLVQQHLAPKYGAVEHWAKIEPPPPEAGRDELEAMRARLRSRYPIEAFNIARGQLDPNGVLSNGMVDTLFTQI
jgi:L-galactono-1,4-lactone dehydrogenase